MLTIDKLEIGREAVIEKVGGEGVTRTHFLDMGLIPGAVLKVVARAPMGDPIQKMRPGDALATYFLNYGLAADLQFIDSQHLWPANLRCKVNVRQARVQYQKMVMPKTYFSSKDASLTVLESPPMYTLNSPGSAAYTIS